jgi:hypothetical protein
MAKRMHAKKTAWIETKREYIVDELGNKVLHRTTSEIDESKDSPSWFTRNKEPVDFILRLIGVAAIAIPLLLFARGQTAELNKQKALLQIDGYSRLFTELNIVTSDPGDSIFDSHLNILNHEIYPKIELFSTDSIIKKTAEILNTLSAIPQLSNYIRNTQNELSKDGDSNRYVFPPLFLPFHDIVTFKNLVRFGARQGSVDSRIRFLQNIDSLNILQGNVIDSGIDSHLIIKSNLDFIEEKTLGDLDLFMSENIRFWLAAIKKSTISLESDCIRSNKVLYNQY